MIIDNDNDNDDYDYDYDYDDDDSSHECAMNDMIDDMNGMNE
jgi:hypothetical protein